MQGVPDLDREPRATYTCSGGCGEEQLVWAGDPPEDAVCPDCRRAREESGAWREVLIRCGVPRGVLRRAVEDTGDGFARPELHRTFAALTSLEEHSPPLALLSGPTGTGKTTAAVLRLANVVQCLGVHVAYVPVPRLMLELRESYGAGRPSGVLQRYLHVRWLVLDDLGTEQGTPHELTVLGQLVDERQAQDVPTVVATNLPLERPKDHRGQTIESAPSLLDYDSRLVSRLLSGRIVVLDGPDQRLAGARDRKRPPEGEG